MKYFLDTEFNEDFIKPFLGKKRHFIDLVSIGIVAENGREYYAISKDFDLKKAWNKWQQRTGEGDRNNIHPKHYWLRENVLYPIFKELCEKEVRDYNKGNSMGFYSVLPDRNFCYSDLRKLIKRYGKNNSEIAGEIVRFIHQPIINKYDDGFVFYDQVVSNAFVLNKEPYHEFYGYYADYDWVLFCSLFGTMMDLPLGFSMYCRDLKQMLDFSGRDKNDVPKQENEHNALADAKWNLELYKSFGLGL